MCDAGCELVGPQWTEDPQPFGQAAAAHKVVTQGIGEPAGGQVSLHLRHEAVHEFTPVENSLDRRLDAFAARPRTGVYGAVMTALLFLDVDGTLIPYDDSTLAEPADAWAARTERANPKVGRINLALGPRLLALPAELMWATGWLHDANDVISPLLGLPQLPVVDLDEPQIDVAECCHLNWKTRDLVTVAAGRPFVWIDDEITGEDRAWVAENHQGLALLFRIDAHFGLTVADLAAVERWLSNL